MNLALKNSRGEVVRIFCPRGEAAVAVQLAESRRLCLLPNLDDLDEGAFVKLADVKFSELQTTPLVLNGIGTLGVQDELSKLAQNVQVSPETEKKWWQVFAGTLILGLALMLSLLSLPREIPTLEEEMKQHVVKIVKRAKPTEVMPKVEMAVKPTPVNKLNVRRMGALAVLGRLKTPSNQVGGVNLGALQTSAGPGLGGGTAGSGGVQTSLYGKGLVAAPLGVGGNLKGAGGYGTKGKGGGQDGYGKMSLIGSAGSASIPLGHEALIQGGLDRDLIAAVIERNMGQVRFCYEQGLQMDPNLKGRVAVQFVIDGNGRVKTAGLKDSSLGSDIVEDCILLRLKTWVFPVPEGGVDVKVSYPFLLRRVGQGA